MRDVHLFQVRDLARQALIDGQIDDFRFEDGMLVLTMEGVDQKYDTGQARRLLQSLIRLRLRRAMGTSRDDTPNA